MARIVFALNKSLTDEQITAVYDLAEEFEVGVHLWGNTPSLARDSFTWAVEGSFLQIRRFKRALEAMH
ncbi:hypothetical protein [Streptomyces tirandamycinicus]|uniref:Uncharacterized protein n=1 Tax=Streptomyces tirandamycinicus TaxID=2174846 RepID=A0A2S1T263_9ACTN|nr:hypothetical protein [Streptomyces tirandamycinicus]AWI32731.1 hypothetical protein DDW44_30935 [Streptomyces tirandamycinicus]